MQRQQDEHQGHNNRARRENLDDEEWLDNIFADQRQEQQQRRHQYEENPINDRRLRQEVILGNHPPR